jgi:hypothetical protein
MSTIRMLKLATIFIVAMPAFGTSMANAGTDPTTGRIQQHQAQARAQYHECAEFALRVFQGAMSQAGNDSVKIRAARSHYHGNLSRCRSQFL